MNNEREYWTTLDGTNGYYEISNWGRVRNANTKRIKKISQIFKNGHPIAIFYVKTERKFGGSYRYLANEVYKHFSKYPCRTKKFMVKHVDGDWMNCRINNLIVKPHVVIAPPLEIEKLYEEKCYSTVKSVVYGHYYKKLPKNSGFDYDDFIQEAMLDVWKYLADYDPKWTWESFVWNIMTLTWKHEISKYYKHLHVEYVDGLATDTKFAYVQ